MPRSQESTAARAVNVAHPDALPGKKMLAWAGAGMSAAANFIILGYFSLYATDTLGVPAAVVGVMILVSSLANVAGGLVAAWIVDRSPETRWGKARPYEFAVIGIWLATWALFSTPAALDQTGRIVWLFVSYILINVVFDTLLRANDTLYLARAFANRRVYAKVLTRAGVFTTITGIVLSITLPIALNWAGKAPERWSVVILAFAVPLAILGMTRFLFVKEEFKGADAGEPPVKMRDLLSVLKSSKWVWLLAGIMLLNSGINGANMISYYFRYVVGNLALQSALAGIGIILLPLILIFPRLMKRFAISQILIAGSALGIVGAVFYWFANGNLILLVIGAILGGFAALPLAYLVGVMVLDICNFNEWRGTRRLESTMGAVVGVAGRIGIGLAGLLVGLVLSASGYDGTKDTQSDSALLAINGLFAGIPAVVFAGIIVLMLIYTRFDMKLLPTINRELDERRHVAAGTTAGEVLEEAPLTTNAAIPGEQAPPLDERF